ncbi:MAG: UTP--glucose-phosphate uridylyltransferase [Thermoleophilaceae bacterium]|nr:UTP--glucose-phosphate uridylyltransferase [Thermoleophilaceae bacterium]MEA2454944.1 UTP--glucose-phosphate uridylyltransferase [Thermoleophilaceae bacterium]
MTAAVDKMRAEGLPEIAIETFAHYEQLLRSGEQGVIRESEIEPLTELPDASELPEGDGAALDQVVVLKLNGGLGTSMGMTRAKSLIEVKDGLSFLDVIVRQVLDLRERQGARVPLLLMNSFATRDDTLAALERYPELAVDDLPLDFVQGKVPKLRADDLEPVEWPADPSLEWAPPGHGDVYTSLATSGMLGELLERGYRYLFLSNSDNLGAVLDPRILSWFAAEGLPFLLESTDRTESDRKGGHLARRREDGGLVLRETAQTTEEDLPAFEDIERHRFFNANNIWLDLRALERALEQRDGVLGLPMIVNRKTVDPTDPSSPEVLQLETAMGAAIGVFEGAAALRVPRTRFAPVKTTDQLLVVRSDAFELADDWTVRPVGERIPVVKLDSEYYKLIRDFDARFASGPPSLRECRRLEVEGDVSFGRSVTVKGVVRLSGPLAVPDGAVLEG